MRVLCLKEAGFDSRLRHRHVHRAFFHRAIAAAQAEGSIPSNHDASDLARMLLGVTLGLRVLDRLNPQRGLLESVVRPALAPLN